MKKKEADALLARYGLSSSTMLQNYLNESPEAQGEPSKASSAEQVSDTVTPSTDQPDVSKNSAEIDILNAAEDYADAWCTMQCDSDNDHLREHTKTLGKLKRVIRAALAAPAPERKLTDAEIINVFHKHGIGLLGYAGLDPFPLDGEDAPLFIAAARDLLNRQGEQNGWVSVEDRLPDDGDVVLIKTNKANVLGARNQLMQYHVATFCKGRNATEVKRSRVQQYADECGNNRRPYRWSGDGPCDWFGQEVEYWMPLPAAPTAQKDKP